MLDLELLRSFVSVVDSGGFTRAGERVHRTQSTVSQQIKRLEDDLGQILLDRRFFNNSYIDQGDATAVHKFRNLWVFASEWLSQLLAWLT